MGGIGNTYHTLHASEIHQLRLVGGGEFSPTSIAPSSDLGGGDLESPCPVCWSLLCEPVVGVPKKPLGRKAAFLQKRSMIRWKMSQHEGSLQKFRFFFLIM